jgi:hypothetical protein
MTNPNIYRGLGILAGLLLAATVVLSASGGNGSAIANPKEGNGYPNDYGMMTEMLKPGKYAAGTIASLQNDQNGNPAWIVTGHWKASTTENGVTAGANATESQSFDAAFAMVMTNGSSPHEHKIYNFTLTNMSTPNNTTMVFNGTATITMKDGPVPIVPINVTVLEGNVISISVDPSMTNAHFGDTPIFGIVKKAIHVLK